jgi:hypothetical protein
MARTKPFKWSWPDGTQIIAAWRYPADIARLKECTCERGGTQHHDTHVIMDITQWGFDAHHWLAVHQCTYCKRCWACEGFEQYKLDGDVPY